MYVLVGIVRKRLGLEASLYQILQILSVTLFEKVPILRALEASDSQEDSVADQNQLILFDFYPDSSDPTYRKPFDMIFERAKTGEWWAWGDSNSRPSA